MGLLMTAAKAAVATRVVGSVHRRQQHQWAAQDAAAAGQHLQAMPAPQVVAVQATPAGPSVVEQLTQLAQLRDSGVLTPAEFEVQKQRILAG